MWKWASNYISHFNGSKIELAANAGETMLKIEKNILILSQALRFKSHKLIMKKADNTEKNNKNIKQLENCH